MSYAEPKRLLLGPGDLYFNDQFVGSVKEGIEFKYDPNYAYQRPGNCIADVKGERISEQVTLTAKLCDFKVSQLRRAFGISEAVTSGSFRLRNKETVKLSGTGVTAFTHNACTGTLKVSKLDRSLVGASGTWGSAAYNSGTDYSATVAGVSRIGAGRITDQQYVIVEYDFLDATANAVRVGGEKTAPQTFEMNFVHKQSNGKHIQITFYRAMSMSDISLAFNEKSSGNYTLHQIGFKALVDLTKPEGRNLFEIIEESPRTAS
jgi:hypothetical protein